MNLEPRLQPQEGARRDAGFTLVELMVTMLVTGIVLAMAGTFFANVAKLTDWAGRSRVATGQAALALDQIRAVVRVAINNPTTTSASDLSAVATATPTSFTIYAYSNTTTSTATPTKVTLTLEKDTVDPAVGYLVETRILGTGPTSGYWAFGSAATKRRIAGPFLMAADTPFFRYLNSSSSTPLTATGSGVSTTNRQDITYIEITTTADGRNIAGDSDPVVVTSRVGMPNLYRNVSSSVSIAPLPTPTKTVVTTTPPAPTATVTATTAPTTTTPTTTTPTTTTPTSTTVPTTTTPTTTTPTTTAPTTATATPTPTKTRGIG